MLELLFPIALILIGIGLIVVEVYLIPGFNVVGVMGLISMVWGVVTMFTQGGILAGAIAGTAALSLTFAALYVMWRMGAWDRFVLATSLRNDDALIARESQDRARYLGETGAAITPVRPTGVVEIKGERIEVMTEGEFIAAGSEVRVVAMDRRRYFVRLETGEEEGERPITA